MLGMRRSITFFSTCGFSHCKSEPNLYICHQDNQILIIVLYVDDLILTTTQPLGLKN
jgi:hypothetical protein